jgi:hypothetical protein
MKMKRNSGEVRLFITFALIEKHENKLQNLKNIIILKQEQQHQYGRESRKPGKTKTSFSMFLWHLNYCTEYASYR